MNKNNEHQASQILSKLKPKMADFVVGIGCSAGSLNPLKKLLEGLPAKTSAAYIIVQHLSPDFKSLMNEILEKHASLPIKMIEDMDVIEQGTIYILGTRQYLSLADNRMLLSEMGDTNFQHPIDYFFKSLAEECQNRAVGIVLSGAGDDGSSGLIQLKKVNAICIAQEPEDAEFDGMPQSAIATECCQHILPASDIGSLLKDLFEGDISLKKELRHEHFQNHIEEIFNLVKSASNIDFNEYKTSTAERRIEHRMAVLEITSSADYLDYVSRESKELDLLIKDMMINVTQFFRDPATWDYLFKHVIKTILLEKSETEATRVWVPGCASGEEAFTLSILFEEAQRELNINRKVTIFATDLDRKSSRDASEGVFDLSAIKDIPEDLLTRYFQVINKQLVLSNIVREKVVFATHNVAFDPPFSKMDLVSCRNLLIYFQPSAQKKILSYFHFSLNPKGYLLLGSAESISALSDYYDVDNAKYRVYQKNPETRISLVDAGLDSKVISRSNYSYHNTTLSKNVIANAGLQMALSKIKDKLIKSFAPPTLVLNNQLQLIYSFGDTDHYTLKVSPGISSLHYSNLLHSELTPYITTAIKQNEETQKDIVIENVSFLEQSLNINIHVSYIDQNIGEGGFFLISLDAIKDLTPAEVDDEKALRNKTQMGQQIVQLDAALIQANDLVIEKQQDIEAISEELQCSNEELMAANEELQSSNEELQSVNEELYTVNSEYQEKIKELEAANYDLDNLLKATQLGVIYLDEHLLIRRFTPKARDFVKLLPLDLNRPFSDISLTFSNDHIYDWIRKARSTLERETYELESLKHQKIKLSINPFTDKHDNLEGLILVFEFI